MPIRVLVDTNFLLDLMVPDRVISPTLRLVEVCRRGKCIPRDGDTLKTTSERWRVMNSAIINVPIDMDILYDAERDSRDAGMTLVERLQQVIAGWAEAREDADDLAVLHDAMARDDGTRYSPDEVDRMLDGVAS